MNRDLEILAAWAADKATTDDDVAARPLWAQIAGEVAAYLTETDPPPPDHAQLFEGMP